MTSEPSDDAIAVAILTSLHMTAVTSGLANLGPLDRQRFLDGFDAFVATVPDSGKTRTFLEQTARSLREQTAFLLERDDQS